MYRWASNYARAKCKQGLACTEYKLHKFSYIFIVSDGECYNQLFKNMEFHNDRSPAMSTRY